MKQIQLLGPVDKRVLAYPLFKLSDVMGKTLIVTDDANFRRFSEDYTDIFTLGRSDFYILPEVSEPLIQEMGIVFNTYEVVIIINTKGIFEGNDVLVYCHGSSLMTLGEDFDEYLEEIDHSDVLITLKKPRGHTGASLSVGVGTLGYVWACEESKMFLPCKNSEMITAVHSLFGMLLQLNDKEELSKIIQREE